MSESPYLAPGSVVPTGNALRWLIIGTTIALGWIVLTGLLNAGYGASYPVLVIRSQGPWAACLGTVFAMRSAAAAGSPLRAVTALVCMVGLSALAAGVGVVINVGAYRLLYAAGDWDHALVALDGTDAVSWLVVTAIPAVALSCIARPYGRWVPTTSTAVSMVASGLLAFALAYTAGFVVAVLHISTLNR